MTAAEKADVHALAVQLEAVTRSATWDLEQYLVILSTMNRLRRYIWDEHDNWRAKAAAPRISADDAAELTRQIDDYKATCDRGEPISHADALWLLNEVIYERDTWRAKADLAQKYWTKLGELLLTGGMDDPAFLYGMVEGEVMARRAKAEHVSGD